jgi:superfamily II DNA or RNA helicase
MPSYFDTHADALRFPERDNDASGLRRAQRGAIFAIGSHFSLSKSNALVSMPTGTGKTAVLMMAPYLLRASRTLIITPSRMVRDQIAEEYGSTVR